MFHFTLVSSSRNDSSVDIEVGGNKGRGKKVERQDFFISLESDTNLLVIRLLLVNGGLGNSVKITLAGLGDAAATLVLVLLEDTDQGTNGHSDRWREHDCLNEGFGGLYLPGTSRRVWMRITI